MAQTTRFTDLPSDILYLIFPYLSASEYLRLTNCTRTFFPYRDDPYFWHALTRRTFRIPDQPLLQGARWQWLYQKLLTQTRLYTWGDNKSGNLGHEDDIVGVEGPRVVRTRTIPRRVRQPQIQRRNSGWPRQAVINEEVGIVADVQCGGWSTTMLNSIGAIYVYGILDGDRYLGRPRTSALRRLEFPPAYPPTTSRRYEPSTAIHQFSTGRSSVLGLADDGKVWMWQSDTGVQVRPMHVDLVQNEVKRVVAGWDRNSMYVTDVGIVYWTPVQDSEYLRGARQETLDIADMMLVDAVTIPGTGHCQRKGRRSIEESLESRIGEVTAHIALEHYIVFTTDLNKVFCYPTSVLPTPAPEPIELTTFYTASPSHPFKIRDLQGSFTRFAVFTASGPVLLGSCDLLNAFYADSVAAPSDTTIQPPSPTLISSLRSETTVSIAFGDHHFHALHNNGTIKSFGKELQGCGALGLGNRNVSYLRGVLSNGNGWGDTSLPNEESRTVWFEPLMETWLEDMRRKSGEGEAMERGAMLNRGQPGLRKPFADYFEKEGENWRESAPTEGEMGAYFALKVSAAGWHSAALVLLDDERAENVRDAHIVKPPPSPTLSAKSSDSYEVIEAPWEQLANTVYAVFAWFWEMGRRFLGLNLLAGDTTQSSALAPQAWLWDLGRRFLGLKQRDAIREAEEDSNEVEEKEYTWSKDPFPRLRFEDGTEMPGQVPLNE